MKRFAYFGMTSLVALSASTLALAADLNRPVAAGIVPPAPVFDAPYDWSGGYIGLQAGAAFSNGGSATLVVTTPAGVGRGAPIPLSDETSFIGGILGGYNFQKGNIVFGIDNDFSYAGLERNLLGATVELQTISTARLRAGYAFDRVLPYVTGGLAYSFAEFSNGAGNDDNSVDLGWTVGAGVEYAATDNIRLRLQYNYIDLGENEAASFFTPVPATTGITTALETDNIDAHVIRAGVSITTKSIIDAIRGR